MNKKARQLTDLTDPLLGSSGSYGKTFIKKMHKFETNDYKLHKCHPNQNFLLDCQKSNPYFKVFII